jgi:integrase
VGRKGDGVEIRANSIRLFFVDPDGTRCRETLTLDGAPLKPTAANIAHAKRQADKIRKAIELGTFRLADFFPDSARAYEQAEQAPPKTFGPLADLWFDAQGELAGATKAQYRDAIGFWKRLLGDDTPIDRLTHQVLAAKLGKYPWASAKLFNNYLIPLRGIFAFEYSGPRVLLNPMNGIANRKVVKKLPDPLTAAERDRILVDMAAHYDARVVAYFTFAFYTGMRPEEIIALQWGDIDWDSGIARVQRVRTFRGGESERTKTYVQRDVDLVPRAADALKTMKAYTFLKRDEDGSECDIFENPVTGRRWHDERSQREHYWHPTLNRLGIRRRRPYCTRHTYCTVALMAGIKPAYIAAQAGHSIKMLLDVYARWIPANDGGTERARLIEAMGGNSSPEVPQSTSAQNDKAAKSLSEKNLAASNVGRRDWTRTNDPHHVKDVDLPCLTMT